MLVYKFFRKVIEFGVVIKLKYRDVKVQHKSIYYL